MDRIRVAALQYFIRPVQTFAQFRDQVEALVETAGDSVSQAVVGMAASLIVLWDDYEIRDNWRDFTDGGMFHRSRSPAWPVSLRRRNPSGSPSPIPCFSFRSGCFRLNGSYGV